KSGRYGPYVSAGGVNATIPSDRDKDQVTLAEAIALIDERAAKGGGKGKAAKGSTKAAKPAKEISKDTDDGEEMAAKPAKKASVKKAAAKPKAASTSK